MTYADALLHANTYLRDCVFLVLHADIALGNGEQSFGLLTPNVVRGRALVLSRENAESAGACGSTKHGVGASCCIDYKMCHDGVLLLSPVPDNLIKALDYYANTWGGENVLIMELVLAGYSVHNPCLLLPLKHHHCSAIRPLQAKKGIT